MTQKVDTQNTSHNLPPFMPLKAHFVHKIWGGNKLRAFKGLNESGQKIGETWEISCLLEGASFYKENKLSQIIETEKLPYLAKFLDTTDNLSVQVHPNDDYAKRVENTKGKTECWLILEAEKGAGIYLGFKKGIKKEAFFTAVKNNENLESFLNFIPVTRGDFFYVPAGSVHAIGKGITLVEIQQSSGVTYRVWDWNRVDDQGKGRELHIDKSYDVLEFAEEKNTLDYFKYSRCEEMVSKHLISHEDFNVHYYAHENFQLNQDSKSSRYAGLIVLEGELTLSCLDKDYKVKAYESALMTKIDALDNIDASKAKYIIID